MGSTEIRQIMEKKKIIIIDDHPIVRRGLTQMISAEHDMAVCGEAESASEALTAIEQTQPDLALVDISLKESNGIDLIKDIRVRWPMLPVLVVSMHDESFYAERVLRAGAKGYITKGESSEKVVTGIRRVLRGDICVGDKVVSNMISLVTQGRAGGGVSIDQLSDRELQVFEMIGNGMVSRQIAERLYLSVKTVDSHRENIKKKLHLANAAELLQRAIQWVQQGK